MIYALPTQPCRTTEQPDLFSRKDTDMQIPKILHTFATQTMHQAALAQHTPQELLKASKRIHLIMTTGYNKIDFAVNFSLIMQTLIIKVQCVQNYVKRCQ